VASPSAGSSPSTHTREPASTAANSGPNRRRAISNTSPTVVASISTELVPRLRSRRRTGANAPPPSDFAGLARDLDEPVLDDDTTVAVAGLETEGRVALLRELAAQNVEVISWPGSTGREKRTTSRSLRESPSHNSATAATDVKAIVQRP
jgi:hypothetical protein